MSRRREQLWVAGLCALLLAPLLAYRMGVDQGVFAYMGAELLDGRWPYVDTWESDFPGMVFLQAAEIFLFGRAIYMFRLFDLLFALASAMMIFRVTSRAATWSGALLAAGTFCLIYQGYGPWNTGQREGFGLLFVLLGYGLFVTAARRPAALTALGIGAGLGIAALFKPTLLALAAFYLPVPIRSPSRAARIVAVGVAGVMAPVLIVVAIFWLQGGLPQMIEATIAHQGVYTRLTAAAGPRWLQWVANVSRLGGTSVALAIGFAPFLAVRRDRRLRLQIYTAYLASLFSIVVQGTFAGYHYIPGLALGAMMIGIAFSDVTGWVGARALPLLEEKRQRQLRAVLAHLLLLAATLVYWRPQTVRDLVTLHFLDPPRAGEFRNAGVFDFTEDWELAGYLQARTEPAETIQVWGYESLVYYLAERSAASRFQSSHALVMRPPGEPLPPRAVRWREEFMRDLRASPPAYFAVVSEDDWWWAPERQTSMQLLDDFPELRELLETRYEPATRVGRFFVYRLEDPSGIL